MSSEGIPDPARQESERTITQPVPDNHVLSGHSMSEKAKRSYRFKGMHNTYTGDTK
jgi:hypothetical protein